MALRLLLPTALVIAWSSGFVGATLAAGTASVDAVLAWRYVATAALLIGVLLLRGRRLSKGAVLRQATIGVLSHVIFLGGVYAAAAAGLPGGQSALICALQPMLVAAAARRWWGDRISAVQLGGILGGLIAVALTVGTSLSVGTAALLPLASVLALSAAVLLERHWSPPEPLLDSMTIQVVVAAACFTIFSGLRGTLSVTPTWRLAGAIVWLVLLSGLAAYAALIACTRRLGPTTTSVYLYLTPPVTVAWEWLMFGATPSFGSVTGLALGAVSVGLFVSGTRAAEPRHRRAPAPRGRMRAADGHRSEAIRPGSPPRRPAEAAGSRPRWQRSRG